MTNRLLACCSVVPVLLLTSAVAFRNENWATNGPACL